MLKSLFSFLLFWLSLSAFGQTAPHPQPILRRYADGSVLRTGEWYKIGVTTSGLYKLDKAALQKTGISTTNLSPQFIRLFGNGGGMLPQLNATPRTDDLVENAIYVAGETDGKFDDGDYVLFYAQGPHTWELEANKQTFRHQYNIYSDTAYYFLQVGQTAGLRVQNQALVTGATVTITSYQERLFHEDDLKNKLLSGRQWLGEEFSSFTLSRDFIFPVPAILPESIIQVKAAVVGDAPSNTSFNLKLNDTALGTIHVAGRGNFDYHPVGVFQVSTFEQNSSAVPFTNELKVNVTYNTAGNAAALGYLDYLEILMEAPLKLSGNQTLFRSLQNIYPGAVSSFTIGNMPPEAVVWDVTNPTQPQSLSLTHNGSEATFTTATDSLKEFIAFTGQDFPAPSFTGKVINQNLHELNKDGKLNLVIVTHPHFLPQAERLATHRQTHDNLQAKVVTTNQIYNEFSSGAQDVTAIRDFMKMLYDRKNAETPLYLLLFGDASYDYKAANTNNPANRTVNNTNYVPVYQSRESLDPLESYSSEDYYGFLDDNEGFWDETNFSNPDLLDIGIGRLPVRTLQEAEIIVNKLIHYNDPKTFGNWRNRLLLVADDGDGNEHLRDAEFLADYMKANHPGYNLRKIYLDMFKQENNASGQVSSEASASIDQGLNQGALLVNYTGHGSETTLAQEKIVTIPQINNWQNKDKLTFLVTATCEFGRYDDPARASGAEQALLNANGGAIGLISTTRPVYAGGNRVLNKNFFEYAFTPMNGQMPRLGDVLRLTKNSSLSQVNNRNFALLCDPSMRLAYPALQVSLDKVNNRVVTTGIDTLKALSTITLTGSIKDLNNTVATNFNGRVQTTVFEKETQINTLGDESANGVSNVRAVQIRENIIYDGIASVRDGLFSVTFMVPKDIAYNLGKGKISFYAYSDSGDAHGVYTDVIVGGASSTSPPDTKPPTIRLFMDDESFVSGGLTGTNTTLIAHIADESGINTTGVGIGHEITAILDNNKSKPISLNNYYTAEIDNYKAGQVRYPFTNLSVGEHTLTVKAWDNYNNSAESEIELIVASSEKLVLDQVFNFPNPVQDQTTFQFNHNRAGEDLDIKINIFNSTGSLIKTVTGTSFASKPQLKAISWNGLNENNQAISKGLYIYVLHVRSKRDGSEASKTQKLILLK
ncbi:type IX secretion system sortase PorU [Adhaeribacter swui]|uniref:Type IX secretion system sortase PorU n=1 Tax=Adhaeribacter swui TaxID=2086471 RepID=A0A7G7G3I6_9BACT|nr:type IX secretion system sortase PorU [Adhaeribacter swui]QNF31720.1 type IX secretion system sortase PorU [Adhaeribacter swui]